MIFKTFDSDSDKILSKIGILGKSSEQISTSIRQRKIEIDTLMGAMSKKEAKVKVGGFWSYIWGNKSIKEKPIDLSKFIDLDNSKASNLLKSLQEIEVSSKTNTYAWQKYFSTLSDGQKWKIEFVKNNDLQKTSTEDLIKANQQARDSALAHNEALKAQTLSAKASKVALQTLATVCNLAASYFISTVISGISNIITANNRFLEKAKELGNQFVQEKNSIEDYKNKIKELHSTINDNSSFFEEVTQARVNLMGIQDELIEKFGTEKNTIDTITDAINGQSDALDRLTKKQYLKWKNDFNDKDFGQSVIDYISSNNVSDGLYHLIGFEFEEARDAFTRPNKTNIKKTVREMR